MAKENIFVKGVGTVEVSPKNIVLINSLLWKCSIFEHFFVLAS